MLNDQSSREIQLHGEVQQFLHAAVHDLRAAQRRTAIATELLLQSPSDQERDDLSAQVLQGLARTEELLTGIANYANALAPSRQGMAMFPASRAVRFAVQNLDRRIRETGATVTVGELPEIYGDRDRLAELFEHLIANSIKFHGPEPPVVEIGATGVPEGWLFTVRDNGEGIAEKYRDRLFFPFRRLQGPEIPGAGLGLAISRKIVEAHGGKIWIDSREGRGVTIAFTLPAGDGA
jgi:light-regulated signal transduction histidine kinase (bacteriophytochrome)